jgi:hypothetical protein
MTGRGLKSSRATGNSLRSGAKNSGGRTNTMFVPADAVPSAFVGLGPHSSSKDVTPFSGCSEPVLPSSGALSLASQGTGPRLPPECIATVSYVSEND